MNYTEIAKPSAVTYTKVEIPVEDIILLNQDDSTFLLQDGSGLDLGDANIWNGIDETTSPSYTDTDYPQIEIPLENQDESLFLLQDGSELNLGGQLFEEIFKPSLITFMLQEDGSKIELSNNSYIEIIRPI